MFSISLSPNNVFTNCSEMGSGTVSDRRGKGALTESTMLNFLLGLREDRKQLGHDLHDYLRHQSAQRDLGIYFEASEEASDAFKEFKESVVARADSFGRLI